jgi:hypothetical protein
MENRSFALFAIVLVVLIALALWQFYSLAWGGGFAQTYPALQIGTVPHNPDLAAIPE